MNEELLALMLGGAQLTDEAKQKITEAFDSAVDAKVKDAIDTEVKAQVDQKTEEIQSQFDAKLADETKRMEDLTEKFIKESLTPAVDQYLTAAAQDYFKENKEAVESNIKVQLAESFLTGLSSLAKAHNVDIPAGADNMVESLKNELADVKAKLNAGVEKVVESTVALQNTQRELVILQKTMDLTDSQREKIVEQSKSLTFNDPVLFGESVVALVKAISPEDNTKKEPDQNQMNESVDPWVAGMRKQLLS